MHFIYLFKNLKAQFKAICHENYAHRNTNHKNYAYRNY